MKTKALLLCAVLILLAGSMSAATLFRIVVDGQGAIVTSTAPVTFGSTVLVRRSDGTSMSIPANLVLSVSKVTSTSSLATSLGRSVRLANPAGAGTAISISGNLGSAALAAGSLSTARVATTGTSLAPGQTLVIGQTGGATATGILPNRAGTATAAADTIVLSPRAGTPLGDAGTALASSANPLAASIERQIFQGDLVRDTARTGLMVGTNATANGDFIIGPNGFPVPITVAAATAAAAQTVIGPNGFPVPVTMAQTAPQTVVPVIGPNGFPATGATASGPAVQTGLTRGIATIPATVDSAMTSSAAAGGFGSPTTGAAAVSTTGATAATSSAASSGSPQ